MKLTYVYFIVSLLTPLIHSDTTVTIYPEWLSQGGRYRYDRDRWNKHNGLEPENIIPKCRSIGTESGRWIHPDYNNGLFGGWPEDPNHKGYPDPNYLRDVSTQERFFSMYLQNIESGYKNSMVLMNMVQRWPSWLNQSEHKGIFPNNLDAAAEFMVLMMQGIYDYTRGRIPPYFEVMNEPEADWEFINFTTVALFHKIVADKLHSKFAVNVDGPTLTGYSSKADIKDFAFWKQIKYFIDVTINCMDTFTFHSYNNLIVSGKSHRFSGNNEARVVTFVDLVENYYVNKTGRVMPLSISEYGRGPVDGLNDTIPSPIIDFATIYQANAHRFTQLALREYVDRSALFVLPYNGIDWSLFALDGKATRLVDIYKFWYNFTSDYRFLRTSSLYDSKERMISPLVLSNPLKNETIILLHSYSQDNQTVTLDFQQDWNVPPTGEAMCITLMDNWYPNITYHSFDLTISNGKVHLRPEETCQFKFKTSFDPRTLPTVNEITYYGDDMVIPMDQAPPQTIITLPHAGFHTATLRISVSLPTNLTKYMTKVTLNNQILKSFYLFYDSDKLDSDTCWNAWVFSVPPSLLQAGKNIVRVYFSGEAGGYVSSVALVAGIIAPTEDI